jgi:hypothetical protein
VPNQEPRPPRTTRARRRRAGRAVPGEPDTGPEWKTLLSMNDMDSELVAIPVDAAPTTDAS